MNGSMLTAVIAVVAVLVLGLLMRRGGGGSAEPADREPDRRPEGPDDDSAGDEDDDEHAEAAAVTSDGTAFFPDVHAVRLVPAAGDEDEPWAAASRESGPRNRRGDAAIGASLHAGDFTGLNIRRGGADESPWILESLGRDGEYLPWGFESEDAAQAADALLRRKGILARDADGEPRTPPSREAWDEARRIWHETQAELALDADEPGEDPR